jgi:adenylate kinase family enzyme
MNVLNKWVQLLRGVTTVALVGASGTGKSYRSKLLAQKHGLEVIIDDGLLIQDDRILAGHSAKREQTFIGAVRAALFDDKRVRDEVMEQLQKTGAKRVLILGTSERMVRKIAERLELPAPARIIHIEEIAAPAEIAEATRSRRVEGKHVIPVPAIEIKQKYPNIFHTAVRLFHRRRGLSPGSKLYEKSVVRPEYSKKGVVSISEEALGQMVLQCTAEYDREVLVKKLAIRDQGADGQGYRIVLTVEIGRAHV